MTETKKTEDTVAVKPADQAKPTTELSEKELQQISGGRVTQACATGKHIPKGVIIT